MEKCCDMRGFLSFLVLRLIKKKNMSGEEIRKELMRRKGTKPSPGTVYPALKCLREYGWIYEVKDKGKEKKYRITVKGKMELERATRKFVMIFCDMKDEFEKFK